MYIRIIYTYMELRVPAQVYIVGFINLCEEWHMDIGTTGVKHHVSTQEISVASETFGGTLFELRVLTHCVPLHCAQLVSPHYR